MLSYFVQTTEQLILVSVLLGLVYGYCTCAFENKCKWFLLTGSLLGVVLASIMTYMKTFTSKVNTGMWNIRIFVVSGIALVLFFVFLALSKKLARLGRILCGIFVAIYCAMLLLYYLPAAMELPHTALLTEDSALSTTYIITMVGVVFGGVLALVILVSTYKGALASGKRKAFVMFLILSLLNSAKYVGTALGTLLARRFITNAHPLYHSFFVYSKNVSNHSDWFIYTALVLALILQIILIVGGFKQKEPYSNPAQRRKIIAKWRRRRKWGITTIICAVLTVLTMTAIESYANQEVELSPIEDAALEDSENIYVAIDQVSDGSLHRFAYTAENGTQIRFIVIQKSGTSTYGVGLDACDICGETGYYQKGEQVICNLCDQPIVINTIGVPGGCNPIVIDYSIEGGFIIVPIEGLIEYQSEFE